MLISSIPDNYINLDQVQNGTQTIDIAGSAAQITPIQQMGPLIQMAAGAVFSIGGLAVLYFLLVGGFTWVTAGGDKGNIEKARNMITNAIIGIIILASVFAVYKIVLKTLAVPNIDVGGGGSSGQITGGTGGKDPVGPYKLGEHYSFVPPTTYCKTSKTDLYYIDHGSGVTYPHFEPCKCEGGDTDKAWAWTATCQ